MDDSSDRAVLDLEHRLSRGALRLGQRERAAWEELGMTPTQYAAALNRLADDAEAVQVYPQLIARLRRLRD